MPRSAPTTRSMSCLACREKGVARPNSHLICIVKSLGRWRALDDIRIRGHRARVRFGERPDCVLSRFSKSALIPKDVAASALPPMNKAGSDNSNDPGRRKPGPNARDVPRLEEPSAK